MRAFARRSNGREPGPPRRTAPPARLQARIQTKLATSGPGDVHEQEADRVADEVMRGSASDTLPNVPTVEGASGSVSKPLGPGLSTNVQRLQAKEAGGEARAVTPAVAARLEATKGTGEPLPNATRSFMESRFGFDFGAVRIHSDNAAASLNRQLGSHAFTLQRDIYFGANKLAPGSAQGMRLLAHELTHVVQQSGATGPSNIVQRQPADEGNQADVVAAVIEAMQRGNAIAGVNDVDSAFEILNKYSISFLLPVLAEVFDKGYFYGFLGYLAPGTKAEQKVVVAIRFTQCEKDPTNLAYEEILEAKQFLDRIYGPNVPTEFNRNLQCLDRIAAQRLKERSDRERAIIDKEIAENKRRKQEKIQEGIEKERKRAGKRQGPKTLAQGTMDWWLVPLSTPSRSNYRGQPSARIQIKFTANAANQNKTITFLQTVHETSEESGSASVPLLDIGKTTPFEPFYGADYSPKDKQWTEEGAPEGYMNAPSSAGNATASLYDEPSAPPDVTKTFESVAVVPATGETLGALRWGVKWGSGSGEVFGAESDDCTDTPSRAFETALKRFYTTPKTLDMSQHRAIGDQHYAAILDGYTANEATLSSDQKKQLDPIVKQLQKFENLTAIVGGFADDTEKDPNGIADQRAENAKTYLVEQGAPKDRVKTGGFGGAWARFTPGAKETRNRRVQVLLRF